MNTAPATLSIDRTGERSWDVVVVGAGPAGSVAARQCARSGARTLLIDKASYPRTKVCGGCLGHAAIELLDQIGLGACARCAEGFTYDRLHVACRGLHARLPIAPGIVVDRGAFDGALANAAVDLGAALVCGAVALDSRCEHDGEYRFVRVRARGSEHRIAARCVIAADGLAGRFMTASTEEPMTIRPASRIGAGTVVDSSAAYEPGVIHMAVGRGGYVGVVRVSERRLIVAASLDAARLRALGHPGALARLLLDSAGLPPINEIEHAKWKGTPGLTRRRRQVAARRLLAIGDTSGYIEPITGEGMTWAIASAIAVAPIAVQAAEWDIRLAARWRRDHARIVRARQWPCRLVRTALKIDLFCAAVVGVLGVSPWVGRPFVSHISRSYTAFQ